MPKNQLFKINPDQQIVCKILDAFGLTGLDDTRYFSREYLTEEGVVSKLHIFQDELQEYYMKCKRNWYIPIRNEKKAITVLRQFIKPYGYKCQGTEKSVGGEKTMMYQMVLVEREQLSPKADVKREFVLTFD